ncbi:MAG: hypothetical protein ACR2J9_11035, partial [Gaiellales bacterium]
MLWTIAPLRLQAQLGVPFRIVVMLALIGWLATTVLYLAARLTFYRHQRDAPLHVAWLILLFALVGVARAAAVLALPESRDALGGGWSSVVIAGMWLVPGTVLNGVLITYLIAVLHWYAGEQARLVRFEVAAEAARLRTLGALDAARAVITTRIQGTLEERFEELERAASGGAEDQLPDALLNSVRGYVRPESHRLWQERGTVRRGSTVADLERASLAAPLPIALPYALWATIVIPSSAAHFGGIHWLPSALATLVVMAVLYPLGRVVIRRWAPAPHYLSARVVSLIFMLAVALTPLVTTMVGGRDVARLQVYGAACIVVFTLAVSWAQAGLRVKDSRLGELRSHAEQAEIGRLALEVATEQMQRELALHLHSTVQAGLVASAYSIQDAVNRNDPAALETAIADARTAIARVGENADEPAMPDLDALRTVIDERWGGAI